MTCVPWDDDRKARLREVWPRLELTLERIAPQFGVTATELSRNAKRMGLPRRAWLRWRPRERNDGRATRI